MLHYDELKEAIDKGFITGEKVKIVRKEGKIFDYILPNETSKPHEIITTENTKDVLDELISYHQIK